MKYFIFVCAFFAIIAAGEDVVQIFPSSGTTVQMLGEMDLPIYARMENSYIGVLNSSQTSLLDRNNIPYQIICTAPSAGEFYIVTPGETMDRAYAISTMRNYCEILLEHGGAFLVIGEPNRVENLPQLRFHITRINRQPMVLKYKLPLEPVQKAKYNPVVKWVIDQITTGEVSQLVRDLSGENPVTVGGRTDTIRTRYTSAAKNSIALKYYYEKAQSYGVDSVVYHPFDNDSNVVATRTGRVYPRQQYLIGGHIDCTSEIRTTYAPGADDNATGTVAGLIAAKYIRGIPFKRTIKFVAWNAEEQGLIGSYAYSSEASTRGDSIIGYLNGDMLGYQISGNNIRIYNGGLPGSITLSNKFVQMNTDYSLGLNVRVSTQAPTWSDHYSFWLRGYDAICAIEYQFNPEYHTTRDRINIMDTVFFCNVVKCMVATVLELAEPDTVFPGVAEGNKDNLANKIFSIRPNPASRSVNFVVNNPRFENGKLEIYDITGKRVQTFDQPVAANRSIRLELAPGVYFAKYTVDNGATTSKFVIVD